jgi:ADP-heptose:LPS heptosyltransferase
MYQNSCQETAEALPVLMQPGIERVAVFRALQLGDMLCAVPALRALRATLPNAHITLVGLKWAEQFAQRFPKYIDDFQVFPGHPAFPEQPVNENELEGFYQAMRERNFSLALQLHGSGEISNQIIREFGARFCAGYVAHDADDYDPHCFFPYPESGPEPLRMLDLMRLLGSSGLRSHMEFPLSAQDFDELQNSGLAAGLETGRYICIHPGARFRNKCWPAHRFAEIADQLANEFGMKIVLTGSEKEIDLANAVADYMKTPAINTASPLSIGAMAALMSRSRLLVCNDTGVSHIAAGLGLKSVVIFNNAHMDRWSPVDHRRHRCIWDPVGDKAGEALEHARILLMEKN